MSHQTNSLKTINMIMLLALMVVVLPGLSVTNASVDAMGLKGVAQSGLTGQVWYLEEFNHSDEDCRGKGYLLKFINDTIAECAMPCNTAKFRYASIGASLTFASRGTTLLPCTVTREFEFESTMKLVRRMIAAGKAVYLLDDSDTLLSFIDAPKPPLSRTSWVLEQLDHSSDNIAGYRLTFPNDTIAITRLHCNTCSYRYTIKEKSIAFANGICTMVACMPANREGQFETAMRRVSRWQGSEFRLLLMDSVDTLMSYLDSAVYALIRQPWLLRSIQRDSSLILIENPEKYTLTFMADGTVRVVADCNTCGGSYSVANGISQLFVNQLACTKVNCGPGSQDMTYLSLLNSVNGCRIRSDTLVCYSPAGGTLRFTGPTTSIGPSYSYRSVEASDHGISIIHKNHAMVVRTESGTIVNARLLDVRGACVRLESRIVENRAMIRTAGLPAGVYLLFVVSRTGEKFARSVCLAR